MPILSHNLKGFNVHRASTVRTRCAPTSSERVIYSVSEGLDHDRVGHSEHGGRVTSCVNLLASTGLDKHERVSQLEYAPATSQDIKLVHTTSYVDGLAELVKKQDMVLLEEDGPTYATTATFDTVLKATGAAMNLVDRIVAESQHNLSPSAFAIVRPPGHHAVPSGPLGFCLFSTIAVAARHAQQKHGLSKVLIYDFDVHHGNGTQDAFYNDPSVLFVSTHQDGSWPGTGKSTQSGDGDGQGYTMNINMPGDSGDNAYHRVWEEVVVPAATRFQPDMILVSAGYDGHWRDPLGGLQMRTSSYHWICAQLKSLANDLCGGRVVFILEGGYDMKGLSESVADSFNGVLDLPSLDKFNPALLREEPLDKVRQVIADAKIAHEL